MTMDTRLMTSLARTRLYAVLLGGFAGFAMLIAMIGLFGGSRTSWRSGLVSSAYEQRSVRPRATS